MRKIFIAILFGFATCNMYAQYSPLRLQAEVDQLDTQIISFDNTRELILFTGSSSIRKWDSIAAYFPQYAVINAGFGGSQMSDLLYYADRLIIKYKPDILFIYEGDNDIAVEKTAGAIMATADSLMVKIQRELPGVQVYFISAKPSLARWDLKEQYLVLNLALKSYCDAHPGIYYADVWNIMLNGEGLPDKNLFIADGLHLTGQGYNLWAKELNKYLESNNGKQ